MASDRQTGDSDVSFESDNDDLGVCDETSVSNEAIATQPPLDVHQCMLLFLSGHRATEPPRELVITVRQGVSGWCQHTLTFDVYQQCTYRHLVDRVRSIFGKASPLRLLCNTRNKVLQNGSYHLTWIMPGSGYPDVAAMDVTVVWLHSFDDHGNC